MIGWCQSFDKAYGTQHGPEANKEIYRRTLELLDANKYNEVETYLSDDLVVHRFGMPDLDKKGYFEDVVRFAGAVCSDAKMSDTAILAERDLLACATLWSGTFDGGETFGLKPSGQQIAVKELNFLRFAADKIAEIWFGVNTISVVRQIYEPHAEDQFLPEQPWVIARNETRLTPVEQRALLLEYFLSVNWRDYDRMEACWAYDGTSHWISAGLDIDGIDAIKETWKQVGQRHRVAPELVVVDGDLAAVHYTIYPDIPGLVSNSIPISAANLYRFDTCRIVEEWGIWDQFALQKQIETAAAAVAAPA